MVIGVVRACFLGSFWLGAAVSGSLTRSPSLSKWALRVCLLRIVCGDHACMGGLILSFLKPFRRQLTGRSYLDAGEAFDLFAALEYVLV